MLKICACEELLYEQAVCSTNYFQLFYDIRKCWRFAHVRNYSMSRQSALRVIWTRMSEKRHVVNRQTSYRAEKLVEQILLYITTDDKVNNIFFINQYILYLKKIQNWKNIENGLIPIYCVFELPHDLTFVKHPNNKFLGQFRKTSLTVKASWTTLFLLPMEK